jgi:hypothetical protein
MAEESANRPLVNECAMVEESRFFGHSPITQIDLVRVVRGHVRMRRRAFIKVLGSGLSSLSVVGVRRAVAATIGTGTSGEDSPGPGAQTGEVLALKTNTATFRINATGSLSAIEGSGGRNYVAPGEPAPVLSLRVAGKLHPANRAVWTAARNTLTLDFDNIGATATLAVREKATHVAFELIGLRIKEPVELVVWGPYPTIIGDLVGEVIGVVRDSEFAVGIQALNAKTLGGFPSQESDIEPEGVVADDSGTYPGLPSELRKQQRWLGETAKHTPFGSCLQAYCRNRGEVRSITNWGNENFPVLPFDDGGVVGSKIALLAVPAAAALPTIGEIEVAEGLPHPMLNGTWTKVAPGATASYLIVDFGESTIDQGIEMTRRAGLKYLYHSSPFETWGHFKLKPSLFPNGWDGFRECVLKGRKAGIGVGFHNLSNFITPNDPYVTPKPDARLAVTGRSVLASDLDKEQTTIQVADPTFFQKKTAMNTVVIGEELISYGSVSADAPWRLLECQRGAWGTVASRHQKSDVVAKLMDHDYKVFLTDTPLGQEIAKTLAAFCNHTDARQLSFDGIEGNWSGGMGQYGCDLFTKAWYDALKPELRGHIINDASNAHHFTWHIATRYNWGEPWYAGFRQSQTLYRLKNQLFFTRNLIPRMLGWFSVRPETTVEDAEWLCARAAGYDAGFALATSFDSQAKQGSADVDTKQAGNRAVLEAICQWENARQTGAFPESVKQDLRDVDREFRLRAVGPGEWELRPTKPAGAVVRILARADRMKTWEEFNGWAIEE